MTTLGIGVILPSVAVQHRDRLDLPTAARHAEELGLDSVWHGDHLATGSPSLDCAVALAAASAGTSRIRIGASVYIPAIRPLAWAAKQIASLQHVSGGRLILGVGSGGGPAQWAAAGVPYAERGRRTDRALALLPRLLAGETVPLDEHAGVVSATEVTLLPPVPRPPFWIGNASPVAIRRAAEHGDGWFPSLVTPDELRAGRAALGGAGKTVAVGATGVLGADGDAAAVAAGLRSAYGLPAERAATIPITGPPAAVAERLAEYRAAGADHVVMGFAAGDWRAQCALLAEARALLG